MTNLSERAKMQAGESYTCMDPELSALRDAARRAVHEHNTIHPDQRGAAAPKLRSLFAGLGAGSMLEAPFHCAYGFNISLGPNVYLNAGCTILDTAPVTIHDGCMLGPYVQIYCAQHHKDPELRAQGLEYARPVTLGRNVWIGGAAVILPGVTIGDNAIVGAGAIVTRNVAPGTTVTGLAAQPTTLHAFHNSNRPDRSGQ